MTEDKSACRMSARVEGRLCPPTGTSLTARNDSNNMEWSFQDDSVIRGQVRTCWKN
jgi:hypothetical protein